MHVYQGTFLGMHDGNHLMKTHYARLLRTARLFGKLEYGKICILYIAYCHLDFYLKISSISLQFSFCSGMYWNYKIRKKNCVKNDTINLKYHYVLIFIFELKVLVYSYPFVKEYDVNIRSVNKPVNFGKNIKKNLSFSNQDWGFGITLFILHKGKHVQNCIITFQEVNIFICGKK